MGCELYVELDSDGGDLLPFEFIVSFSGMLVEAELRFENR